MLSFASSLRGRSACFILRAGSTSRGVGCLTQQRSVVFTTMKRKSDMQKYTTKERQRVSDKNLHMEDELDQQLANLESLTNQVKEVITKEKEVKALKSAKSKWDVNDIEDDKQVDEDASAIFNALSSGNTKSGLKMLESNDNDVNELSTWDKDGNTSMMSIFPKVQSYIKLPNSIVEQLDDETLQNIASEETANWIPIVAKLASNPDALQSASTYDMHYLLKTIPKKQRSAVIGQFHQMVNSAGLLTNRYIYNDIMATYNTRDIKQSSDIVENLYKEMTEIKQIKPDLFTMGIMVNLYTKQKNVTKVREFLAKIEEMGQHPTNVIYTSILQMYVRMGQYENAADIFKTMKFVSLDSFPNTKTYSSMILEDTLNNNIEHGLSLYEEMQNREMKVEPQALLALAKGCSTRKKLIPRGWQFILEYYSRGFPTSYKLMEVMMALACRDSDLNFVRALYLNIFETNTKVNHGKLTPPNGRALKYLLNSYYFFDKEVKPMSIVDEKTRAIRLRAMDLMNFRFSKDAPPLLPLTKFPTDDDLMMKECKAIFEYHLLKFPEMITREIMEAYLFVIAARGDMNMYKSAWKKYTYLKDEANTVTVEEPQKEKPLLDNDNDNTPVEKILKDSKLSFPRDDRLYNACMHAARLSKDILFAQEIWMERGRYRKTEAFQKLEAYDQDQQDFKFARGMLSCLVECGNVVDAYQLVLSSQSRFIWTYYHLKSLLSLCERMGYTTFERELEKVIHKGNKFLRHQS